MAGLDPATHAVSHGKDRAPETRHSPGRIPTHESTVQERGCGPAWVAGSSPAMTVGAHKLVTDAPRALASPDLTGMP